MITREVNYELGVILKEIEDEDTSEKDETEQEDTAD